MAHSTARPTLKEVPEWVEGCFNGAYTTFHRGKFLGKGGFARCYEFCDQRTRENYAGKVISKKILIKKSQRDKVMQEVIIHSGLCHPNVVALYGNFEDLENVYVVLELCARRSLMEIQKRRCQVTEPEARYFCHQIVEGCVYLHGIHVIHRDLKLGNLFLNDDMIIKIGDFGLATKVGFKGQQKQALCGTPNYIAPEMLMKRGYSYEVDVWAIGCILYTLLVGRPPFETESLNTTYAKIRNNEYVIPSRIGQHAHEMIAKLLAPQPEDRPTVDRIREHAFFTRGFLPEALPVSSLVLEPRFDQNNVAGGKIELDTRLGRVLQPRQSIVDQPMQDANSMVVNERNANEADEVPMIEHLKSMAVQLKPFINSIEERTLDVQDEHPASAPVFWIDKWADKTTKYGFAYQLSDGSTGMLFTDLVSMQLDASAKYVQHVDARQHEIFYEMENVPPEQHGRVLVLEKFREFFANNLCIAGESLGRSNGREYARFPRLSCWLKKSGAIALILSDGTFQINFNDHIKIILCPQLESVTYIDPERQAHTYEIRRIVELGGSTILCQRLRYAQSLVMQILEYCKKKLDTSPHLVTAI